MLLVDIMRVFEVDTRQLSATDRFRRRAEKARERVPGIARCNNPARANRWGAVGAAAAWFCTKSRHLKITSTILKQATIVSCVCI